MLMGQSFFLKKLTNKFKDPISRYFKNKLALYVYFSPPAA
jgi:hypothetical protein